MLSFIFCKISIQIHIINMINNERKVYYMPNYVTNRVIFVGKQKRIDELLEFIKETDGELGSFDFNKVIPMPDSIRNTQSGSNEDAILCYLTAANPNSNIYCEGIDKLSQDMYNAYTALFNSTPSIENYSSYLTYSIDTKLQKSSLLLSQEKFNELCERHVKPGLQFAYNDITQFLLAGKRYLDNKMMYGVYDWYDWSVVNWGTKWNSCYPEGVFDNYDDTEICYCTAWSPSTPVIVELSKLYPDILIQLLYTDEFIGQFAGVILIRNGTILIDVCHELNAHAYEYSTQILGFDLKDLNYYFDPNIMNYVSLSAPSPFIHIYNPFVL